MLDKELLIELENVLLNIEEFVVITQLVKKYVINDNIRKLTFLI
jgi:hypothetical protein